MRKTAPRCRIRVPSLLVIASILCACSSEDSARDPGSSAGGNNAGGGTSGGGGDNTAGSQAGEGGSNAGGALAGAAGSQAGGEAGSATNDAGSDSAPLCQTYWDSPGFTLNDASVDCLSSTAGDHQITTAGVVTQSAADQLTIDSCAADSGCAPALTVVKIQNAPFALSVPVGALVEMRYEGKAGTNAISCRDATLQIVRLDSWGSQQNTIPGPPFYLSLNVVPPESGLTTKRGQVECSKPVSASCGLRYNEAYVREFSSDKANSVTLGNGQETTIESSKGSFRVRNAFTGLIWDSTDCWPSDRDRFSVLPAP